MGFSATEGVNKRYDHYAAYDPLPADSFKAVKGSKDLEIEFGAKNAPIGVKGRKVAFFQKEKTVEEAQAFTRSRQDVNFQLYRTAREIANEETIDTVAQQIGFAPGWAASDDAMSSTNAKKLLRGLEEARNIDPLGAQPLDRRAIAQAKQPQAQQPQAQQPQVDAGRFAPANVGRFASADEPPVVPSRFAPGPELAARNVGVYGQPQQGNVGGYAQPQVYGQPQQGNVGGYVQPQVYGQPQQRNVGGYGQPQVYGQPQQGNVGGYSQPQVYGQPQQGHVGGYGQPQQYNLNGYGQLPGYGQPPQPYRGNNVAPAPVAPNAFNAAPAGPRMGLVQDAKREREILLGGLDLILSALLQLRLTPVGGATFGDYTKLTGELRDHHDRVLNGDPVMAADNTFSTLERLGDMEVDTIKNVWQGYVNLYGQLSPAEKALLRN